MSKRTNKNYTIRMELMALENIANGVSQFLKDTEHPLQSQWDELLKELELADKILRSATKRVAIQADHDFIEMMEAK